MTYLLRQTYSSCVSWCPSCVIALEIISLGLSWPLLPFESSGVPVDVNNWSVWAINRLIIKYTHHNWIFNDFSFSTLESNRREKWSNPRVDCLDWLADMPLVSINRLDMNRLNNDVFPDDGDICMDSSGNGLDIYLYIVYSYRHRIPRIGWL